MLAREEEELFDRANQDRNNDFFDDGVYEESPYGTQYQDQRGMFSQHNKLEEVKQSQD
jgi:hypothetical protein